MSDLAMFTLTVTFNDAKVKVSGGTRGGLSPVDLGSIVGTCLAHLAHKPEALGPGETITFVPFFGELVQERHESAGDAGARR